MDIIYLVQDDTRPQLLVTLTDSNSGDPVDITGATVLLKFRAVRATDLIDTLHGFVTDGLQGKVVFTWNANTLSIPKGNYEGEVEVTFANNEGIQTVFDVLRFRVREDF